MSRDINICGSRFKEKGYKYNFEFLILNFELTNKGKTKDHGSAHKSLPAGITLTLPLNVSLPFSSVI